MRSPFVVHAAACTPQHLALPCRCGVCQIKTMESIVSRCLPLFKTRVLPAAGRLAAAVARRARESGPLVYFYLERRVCQHASAADHQKSVGQCGRLQGACGRRLLPLPCSLRAGMQQARGVPVSLHPSENVFKNKSCKTKNQNKSRDQEIICLLFQRIRVGFSRINVLQHKRHLVCGQHRYCSKKTATDSMVNSAVADDVHGVAV